MYNSYYYKIREGHANSNPSMFFTRLGISIRRHIGIYSLGAGLLGVIFANLYYMPFWEHLIPVSLFIMLFPIFLDVDIRRIIKDAANPALLLIAVVFNITVAPILMYGLIKIFYPGISSDFMAGLLLYSMIPGGGMGPAYTGMINGNINLSIAITTVSMPLVS